MNSSHLAHGEEKDVTYPGLVQFALSLTDSLLFVHYLALILIEIRHRRAQYYVKVRERGRVTQPPTKCVLTQPRTHLHSLGFIVANDL